MGKFFRSSDNNNSRLSTYVSHIDLRTTPNDVLEAPRRPKFAACTGSIESSIRIVVAFRTSLALIADLSEAYSASELL